MKELLAPYIGQQIDLWGVRRQIIIARNLLRRKNPYTHIEFVAGPVTSFGPDRIPTNRANLIKAADFLHEQKGMATFCTPYLGNLSKLPGITEADIKAFTVDLIRRRLFHGITFVGDWEKSDGCDLEHKAALEINLPISELPLRTFLIPR